MLINSTLLKKSAILLLFCGELCAFSANAAAGNWPGWRGDGTGISAETNVVTEWTEDNNIRWKIEIPGYGHSSPIVWDNNVYLTTALNTPGSKIAKTILLISLGFLSTLILFWSSITFFRFPGQPYALEASKATKLPTQFLKIFGLVAIYLVAGFVVFSGLGWLLRAYSAQLNSLGISLRLTGSGSTYGEGYLWALIGIFGACFIYFVNRVIDTRSGQNFTASNPNKKTGVSNFLSKARFICISFAMAGFLGMSFMHFFTLLNPAAGNFNTSWIEISAICSLGIVVAVGSFRKDTTMRLAGSLLALTLMLILLWILYKESPNWTGRGKLYGSIYFVTLLWILVFIIKDLIQSKYQTKVTRKAIIHIGPFAMLVLVALQITSGQIFLSSPAFQCRVICIDRETGGVLWQTICTKGEGKNIQKNSNATPTPATDGKNIYANFGDKGTFCLDLKGEIVWQNTEAMPPFGWRASSSPVLYEGILITTNDTHTKSFTAAFEKNRGHKLWEHVRQTAPDDIDSYSTPAIVQSETGAQLVHQSFSFVTGYELKTGYVNWRLPLSGYTSVVCPVAWKDTVIYTYRGVKPHRMVALQLAKNEMNRNPKTVWEINKMTPGVSSPIVYHGLVYAITDGGIVTCRNVANGALRWKKRLPGSRYYSSIIAAGDKLFFSNMDGETYVLAAGTKPAVLITNQLSGTIYSSPAISEGEIFIRTDKHLYCISDKTNI